MGFENKEVDFDVFLCCKISQYLWRNAIRKLVYVSSMWRLWGGKISCCVL